MLVLLKRTFIPLFALVGIAVLVLWLFMDSWIKLAAEKGLSQAIGAEANIASASHSFSPFSIGLYGIQLTDPANPSHNQVIADEVFAEVALMPLLAQKVIVENMRVLEVAFNQPRQAPGEVYRQPDPQAKSPFALPDVQIELPDVDTLLENSPLKTTAAVEAAQASYKTQKDKLENLYQDLPNKNTLAAYKARFEELKDTDFKDPAALLTFKEKLQALKQDIRADKQTVEQFSSAVESAKDDLKPKIDALKQAPQQDFDQLKAIAAGDVAAIEDITSAIFGEQARAWSNYLMTAFDLIMPMLSASEEQAADAPAPIDQGVPWYAFGVSEQLPQFWVKNAEVSLAWEQEKVHSSWQDITNEHAKIGKSTVFNLAAQAGKFWQALNLDGEISLADSGVLASQRWDLQGIKLDSLPLVQENKLKAQVLSSLLSSSGSLKVEDDQLQGNGLINLNQLSIDASGTNKLTNLIANTLNQLNQLQINTDIGGSLRSPAFALASDLDRQLGAALKNSLGAEAQAKLTELRSKLNQKAAAALGTSENGLAQWGDWQQLADGNLGDLNEILAANADSLIEQQKGKVLDKLKGKLFDKLNKP